MLKYSRSLAVLTLSGAALLQGCASVDRTSAQATAEAPPSAQVAIIDIPYDPNLPRYVIAVEPFTYAAAGVTSGGPEGTRSMELPGTVVGPGLSAQLTTALTHAGNISIIEFADLRRNSNGEYVAQLQQGEVGPFIVRGTVTEFNETADLSGKKRGGSLGALGVGMAAAGVMTNHRDLATAGVITAAANPTIEKSDMKRSGMVGIDLRLVDGRTGRVVRGYTAHGSFTTVSSDSGISLFGMGGADNQFAASALGQATRAAMNEGTKGTMTALMSAPVTLAATSASTGPPQASSQPPSLPVAERVNTDQFQITQISIEPKVAKPGDTISITITLTPVPGTNVSSAPSPEIFIVRDGKDLKQQSALARLTSAGTYEASVDFLLPSIVESGAYSVRAVLPAGQASETDLDVSP